MIQNHDIGVPEEDEGETEAGEKKSVFEEIMVENLPNLKTVFRVGYLICSNLYPINTEFSR